MEYASYVGGRLPTEAEWEYACRAGTTTPVNTGNCLTDLQANYDYRYPYLGCQESTFERYMTQNVGAYQPNPWGLYNIHGNVGEWCSDWYGLYPENAEINPSDSATGSKRVVRGGGNSNVAHRLRSAYRGCNYPEYGSSTTGFRVVFPYSEID
jgi:formylglycine-generating enzyme required for sulfatase activity